MTHKLGIEPPVCGLTSMPGDSVHWKPESYDVEAYRSPLLSRDTITVSDGLGCFLS